MLGRIGTVDARTEQDDRYPSSFRYEGGHFDLEILRAVLGEMYLSSHLLERFLPCLHFADERFADPGRTESRD